MAAFQTLLGLGGQRGATTYNQLYDVELTDRYKEGYRTLKRRLHVLHTTQGTLQ